ncbi:hypothetical protein Tco_1283158 [Tanacetum coccineum]
MPPKRASTTEAPAMTQDVIRKLVADSVTSAFEAQAATMENINNPNRNTDSTGTPIVKMGNYKEFISCQPFYFNGTEGVVSLIRCKQIESLGLSSKRLLTNRYCPRTDRKMEEELYNLSVKGNDLKPYVRRFQELTVLCPNMVPSTEKPLEAFIRGLPRSIEGNYRVITRESLTTEERSTTIPATTTTVTPIIVTTIVNNKTEGKKLVEPMLLLHQKIVGMPEISLCVRDEISITPDLVLANVIFATRADRSFISLPLASKLNLPSITIDTFYDIEMANGNLVSTNTVIKGCTLTLLNHPINDENLIIRGDQITEKKSDEKRLEDIPVVKEFSDVFLEKLPGLPPICQVEFQIDLIPGAAPVADIPYVKELQMFSY